MFKTCQLKDNNMCAFGSRYPKAWDSNGIPICGLLKGELYEIKISSIKECPLIKLQAKKKKGRK